MRTIRRFAKWLIFLFVICMTAGACEQYDPYKNPKPQKQRKQRKHRDFNWPSIPWPDFSLPGGGGGGGGGSGCTRRWRSDTVIVKPKHQREPKQKEDPNGPVYPCPNNIFPFCTDENPYGVTYKSGTHGYAAWPKDKNLGCLKIAPCPVWYYMQIDQPGDLLIYIEQKGRLRERDVDFVCWGPFEAESKRDFLDKICSSYYQLNTEPHDSHRPENGNHRNDTGGYPFDNLVDCSFTQSNTEWCYIPNAKEGEWYLLLLTNYSQKKGTIHFERVADMSTATTNCNVVIPITLNPVPQGLKQIDEHTSAICLYETKAKVFIELETDEGYTLPKHGLQHAHAEVHANGKVYNAKLKGNHFECEIDIENDTTLYYAVVSCPDPNFTLNTGNHVIVKTTDCSSDAVEFSNAAPYYAGDQSFADLVRGNTPMEIDFADSVGIRHGLPDASEPGFSLEDYDVTVDYDELIVERVEVKQEGEKLVITPKLRENWCDCFTPDTLAFRIRMIPNNGDVHATPYEVPVKIGVRHKTVWIGRCMWALIVIGLLVLLLLYLRLLLRKRRFKKNAIIDITQYSRYGSTFNNGNRELRKSGFPAWFARWFLPGAERNTLSFYEPKEMAITFVASESSEVVEVPKSSIDSKTMFISSYDPANDSDPKSPVRLTANEVITILKANGQREGYLKFIPGNERDGGGYRIFLRIIFLITVIAIIALTAFVIRGLL
jgi:hypothetical protein